MRKILSLIATGLLLVSFSHSAHAGFLIEPFLDFAVSGDADDGTPPTGDLSSTMYGLRIGMSTLGFIYGVEYAMGTYEEKYSVSGINVTVDGNSTDMGVFVGYEFPIMLRVWLSYYLQTKLSLDDAIDTEATGSGTKIGVGYTGLPYISINLEMLTRSYDEYDTSLGSGTIDPEHKHTAYLLGISLPLP
ncbi:MAG: hypothetical protein KDD58_03095 [Bdellovibrionales bacterium]|nr:hypothetical protein [Bdellovibrionales bacterium]